MTAPSQFGPGVFFLCHVLVPASNHWCVGELLPPVGTIHGVWGAQNRLEEVLVDLQWEREGGSGGGRVLSSCHKLQIQLIMQQL